MSWEVQVLGRIMKEDLQLILKKKDFDNLTKGLKTAFDNHLQWLSDLNYHMIFEPGKLSTFCHSQTPHQRCKLGQWYYSVDNQNILNYPDFIILGELHK